MELNTLRPSQNNFTKPVVRQKSFLLRIIFVCILFVCIIMGGIISLIRNKQFQFTHTEIYGVKTFSDIEINQFVQQYFLGNQIKVIPRSSTILFSKSKLVRALQKEFPIIAMAHITLPEPNILNIYIQEKQPVCIWCFTEDDCVFLDEEGIVYGKAPNFSDGVYPVFTSEEIKNFDQYKGKQIIEPDTMNRFIALFKNLQSDDITLSRTIFLENGDISFAIEKLFDKYPDRSAKILGTFNQDDTIFIRDMVTGLNHQAFKDQYRTQSKSLEYIDLRFPGKIFYKFKGKEKPLEKVTPQNTETHSEQTNNEHENEE